jgi:predicted DsbA family dithiol-disulfide isomerase
VSYAFRNFPLEGIHPFALKASVAAECAVQQNMGNEMHERLFNNQQALDDGSLFQHANAIGLDLVKFKLCLSSETASSTVKRDIDLGKRLGVDSTPTFFVGLVDEPGKIHLVRKLRGAKSVDTFVQTLKESAPKLALGL